jgi:type I restriction enzyme, S subunit
MEINGMLDAVWEEAPLPEYVFFQEGPGLRVWQWAESGMKVVNGTNILLDGQIDVGNTDKYISMEEFNAKYQHFSIELGDILVTSSGTIGKVAIVKVEHLPLMMNTSVIRFHSKKKDRLDDSFLFAFLRSSNFQNQISAVAIGAAQLNFGPVHLKQMRIPLPPIPIQRRIASILSAYDDLIENSRRRIAILEDMSRRLYREWFVHFRYPGHESVPLVDSPLGRIPQGWGVLPMGTLTSKIGSGATPRGGKESYQKTGIPLIRSMNIYDNDFEESDLAYIDQAQAADLDNVIVQQGDVLLNITGASVARCAMAPSHLLPARVNQHVAIVRAAQQRIDRHYLARYLTSSSVKSRLLGLAQVGATREALTKDGLESFMVQAPPLLLTTRFGGMASVLWDLCENLRSQISVLRRTRDLLLPRLMSGTLSVESLATAEAAVP